MPSAQVVEDLLTQETLARTARATATSTSLAVKEELEVAVRAVLKGGNEMLLDIDMLQAPRIYTCVLALREVMVLRRGLDAVGGAQARTIEDVRGLRRAAIELRRAIDGISLDEIACGALRSEGGLGARRYASGQPLMAWSEQAGQWIFGRVVDVRAGGARARATRKLIS